MNKKRFILVIKAGDLGIPYSPENKEAFKDAVHSYFLKNYGESTRNIANKKQ